MLLSGQCHLLRDVSQAIRCEEGSSDPDLDDSILDLANGAAHAWLATRPFDQFVSLDKTGNRSVDAFDRDKSLVRKGSRLHLADD